VTYHVGTGIDPILDPELLLPEHHPCDTDVRFCLLDEDGTPLLEIELEAA
jgi:hypothetical protein